MAASTRLLTVAVECGGPFGRWPAPVCLTETNKGLDRAISDDPDGGNYTLWPHVL